MRLLGTILLLALGGNLAQAAEPSGQIILDYQSKGILDKAVLRQLWDRTYEIASGVPSADLISADETRKRIFDQSILVATRCDDACFQRIAQKLGARELLVPSVEKTGDQLKFTFTRIRGANGSRMEEVSVWSDGRVGRALTSGLFKVLADGGSGGGELTIPSSAWTSAGIAAVGVGLTLWLGTSQERKLVDPNRGKTYCELNPTDWVCEQPL